MKNIRNAIVEFNEMYRIPIVDEDENSELDRLNNFRKIFLDEVKEFEDILLETKTIPKGVAILDWVGDLMVYCLSECERWGFNYLTNNFSALFFNQKHSQNDPRKIILPYDNQIISFATDLNLEFKKPFRGSAQDLLRNILFDSMLRIFNFANDLNIPLFDILYIIMESNFSKLDNNGNPIFDEYGKLLKGPNFIPPEPELEKFLKGTWGLW